MSLSEMIDEVRASLAALAERWKRSWLNSIEWTCRPNPDPNAFLRNEEGWIVTGRIPGTGFVAHWHIPRDDVPPWYPWELIQEEIFDNLLFQIHVNMARRAEDAARSLDGPTSRSDRERWTREINEEPTVQESDAGTGVTSDELLAMIDSTVAEWKEERNG